MHIRNPLKGRTLSSGRVVVKDPAIARRLFDEVGPWSVVWSVLRVYIGWEWLAAGWHKLAAEGPDAWGAETLQAFWERAVLVPENGRPAIAYGWYRGFLQTLLDMKAESWMSHVIAWGETLVGIALILGAFVGIAAFFGAFMNMNFMLAGSASINPVLMLGAIVLMLAWKTAGWWGLDRWLLPALGTPWSRVIVEPRPQHSVRSVSPPS